MIGGLGGCWQDYYESIEEVNFFRVGSECFDVMYPECQRRCNSRPSAGENDRYWGGKLIHNILCLTQCVPLKFFEIARKTKQICDKYSVPLIINDRVDVALAVGAAGVHLGQTDMPIAVARELLKLGNPGPNFTC